MTARRALIAAPRRGLLSAMATAPLAACAIGRAGSLDYGGPVTAHFDGSRFANPGGQPPRGFADLLRWRFGGDKAAWPEANPSPFPAARPPARARRASPWSAMRAC